ncbi:hypothetical protein BFP76_13360 [Amylibacter kogurei]|uniref:Glucose/Sorbosone dehydrogenase domain-containing protein n=1 Tax=Paramylibacter kogurei TaxID=1889778 RepID=A0A2G5K968_9RHOB|nr:PQQ-dependent sugar dehydrogenase [Amylibacter kogurei]PIB25965.1 hypothetical protein BFP76_13360 [Amylibacter kogurei]
MRIFCTILFSCVLAFGANAKDFKTDIGTVTVTKMIDDLYAPWAIAFLPNGDQLITERDGDLYYFDDGKRQKVSGVPAVYAQGQGGLLDVVVSRNFANTRRVYITYSEPSDAGGHTALAVAKLSPNGDQLTNFQVMFRQKYTSKSTHHFGSRVVEAPNGDLFLTIGDRGNGKLAQSLDHFNGKVVRISQNGTAVIHSHGHRNPQGAALDNTGNLWTVEHGAKGGDEINKPVAGKNYGWPIISYGRNYSGTKIGEGQSKAGMEQPALYWDPSIAPSGMMIYSGKLFPKWKDQIFVGSLKFDMISRSTITGAKATEVERLFQNQFERIRDIREAPDGSIWFLAVGDGAAYRITPQ